MSLAKHNRVLRSAEFRLIYESGIRMSSRFFAAFCMKQQPGYTYGRFGFTVPRAVGKANVRNRIKRRMRAAIRSQMESIPTCAIVFNPRRKVADANFQELCGEIGRIFLRCKEL